MTDRRSIDDLSLAELEQILRLRRREERLRRLRQRGIESELPEPIAPVPELKSERLPSRPRTRRLKATRSASRSSCIGRLLLTLEVIFFVAFVAAAGVWYWEAQQTNLTPPPRVAEETTEIKSEANNARTEEVCCASDTVTVLPGNPTPPPNAEGSPIPPLYNEWIQAESNVASVLQGDLSEQRPIRIAIPKLEIDAPVIAGTDWEALKRGAGHYLGSAFPGERGNMVITAHNDIFGELFRYLELLEPGDEFTVYDALERKYEYVVRTKRIVQPNEVSVLNSSPEPLATLITCYPYLIDSQRLVVQAELLR